MAFSYTGLAYFFLSISLVFLSYRIFKYWKQKNDPTSKYFFYFCLSLLALTSVRAVSGLFFAQNIPVLVVSLLLVSFIEGIMAGIVAYFTIYIYLKITKVLPWVGFMVFLGLGLLTTFLTYLTIPDREFILDESGALNLNYNLDNFWYAATRTGLFALSFIPLIVIFLRQSFILREIRARTRAIGLTLVLFLGFFIGSLDFVFLELLKLETIIRDIMIGALSILMFFVVYFTQKPNPEANVR